MDDVVQLLPESISDQIAAGEVIQRPASVVKELLENAIDAGSTRIDLSIRNAGKTSIQVTDNGAGMSEQDARLAFSRNATSKIREADDLFAIRSKGFRGEALASIGAIAHVEMKTRPPEAELGTRVRVEGSELVEHEPCNCSAGTTITVKNLFYNVPARRKFLKSDTVEVRHIIEEFQRVAFPHESIRMTMQNNEQALYDLPADKRRKRIVDIMGKKFDERLVPVSESTDLVSVEGFTCKPEYARKTRGEQFLFVNRRFIKNFYLDHAVRTAFEDLLPEAHFPSYFLFLEVDPGLIDINIHPTKSEVKFQDEKAIYAIVRSATRKSLGKYNIAPSIDFEHEKNLDLPPGKEKEEVRPPTISVDPNYDPFQEERKASGQKGKQQPVSGWEAFYAIGRDVEGVEGASRESDSGDEQTVLSMGSADEEVENPPPWQLHRRYLVTHIRSGMMMVDQQKAHERILYEDFMAALSERKGASQQQLFPRQLELNEADAQMIRELVDDLSAIGFEIDDLGKHSLVVNGIPAEISAEQDVQELLEDILEQYKNHSQQWKAGSRERLAAAMAKSTAIKPGKVLGGQEIGDLVDRLFACEVPYYSPSKNPTIVTFTLEDLAKYFNA